MKYLVLDGPLYPTSRPPFAYRGANRKWPPYCEAAPADHEINQLWSWFSEELVEFAGVRDIEKAQRYAQLANEHFPGMRFEVVGISHESPPTTNKDTQFLGCDIGEGDSLIFSTALPLSGIERTADDPALVLDELIRRHFRPKLNEFGLFRNYSDAADCRRAMIAVQSFHPDFYEGGDLEAFKRQFEVTGVYLVPRANR